MSLSKVFGVSVAAFGTLLYFYLKAMKPVIDAKQPQNCKLLTGHSIFFLQNYHRVHDFHLEIFESLGDLFQITVPALNLKRVNIVFASNVTDIEYIFRDVDNFIKGNDVKKALGEFLGTGIFVSDGASWRKSRKTAANIFTINNFKNLFAQTFEDECQVLVNHLDGFAETSESFDLSKVFYAFTMDCFGKIAFGVDLNSLNDFKNPPQFSKSFDNIQKISVNRFVDPIWFITEHIYGTRKQFNSDLKILNNFASEIIEKSRSNANDNHHVKNLLDFFMESTNYDGSLLSDNQLRDMALNFMIAGRDTTAVALSWGFWKISQDKEVEAKLYNEIINVFGEDGLPNFESTKDLKYCHAFFYEILRLFPPVPINQKENVNATTLPGTGTFIPAGTIIVVSVYAMARLEKIWGPDAKTFRPERWLDRNGNLKKESAFKWPVFHCGPRVCLGQNLATSEALICIVNLIRRYKFILEPGVTVTYGPSITLAMKNELRVTLKRR